jgi:hypothetical protein
MATETTTIKKTEEPCCNPCWFKTCCQGDDDCGVCYGYNSPLCCVIFWSIIILTIFLIPTIVLGAKGCFHKRDVPYTLEVCKNETIPCGYGFCFSDYCHCYDEYASYNDTKRYENSVCNYERYRQATVVAVEGTFILGLMKLGRGIIHEWTGFAIGFSLFIILCFTPVCFAVGIKSDPRYNPLAAIVGICIFALVAIIWWCIDISAFAQNNINDGHDIALFPCVNHDSALPER